MAEGRTPSRAPVTGSVPRVGGYVAARSGHHNGRAFPWPVRECGDTFVELDGPYVDPAGRFRFSYSEVYPTDPPRGSLGALVQSRA